jgi:hypothetical protein
MAIIGVVFNSMEAKIDRNKSVGKINISSKPVIKNVEKRKITLPNIEEVLVIDFEFETKYEPELGSIKFTGEVLYTEENVDDIIKEWKKKQTLKDSIAVPVLNAVFRRCLTKAIEIAEELQLPPPINFPVVKSKKE